MLDMCFHLILGGRLEGIGIHVGILPVSERIVVERTVRIGVGLRLHDLPSNVFELPFEGQLVFGLLLQPFHHLIYGLVSLLLEAFVFSLMFLQFLLCLLQLCVGGVILCAYFLQLGGCLFEGFFSVGEEFLELLDLELPFGHESVDLFGDLLLCLCSQVFVTLLLVVEFFL
jgi:hypothetical protein